MTPFFFFFFFCTIFSRQFIKYLFEYHRVEKEIQEILKFHRRVTIIFVTLYLRNKNRNKYSVAHTKGDTLKKEAHWEAPSFVIRIT